MTNPTDERESDGRFIAGQAPRSPGRPKGLTDGEKVRLLLEPHRDQVSAKLVELALAGDPAAMKLFYTYLAPPPKPESEKLVIPGLADAPTPQAKADTIISAVSNGAVSFEAGERALRMLHTYMQAITATDHELRLAALEDGKLALLVDEKTAAQAAPAPPEEDCDLT